ncbi:hypothetical protein QE450_000109 [Paenibacillus sp. SORGH_AS306]|uniref:hypothetical protein n=1 Tax=unclassified Paenibacillus TaxID=185978 RepID=UPI00277E77CC|nr:MULTISPECIES: hypothetical protein [unclassified Paenibacillus]MDQ1232611.1 hypothetical protein [Paenibacillus sp. SORGH_AS_0306]MDR6109662.1 hypothetical protein [Paenibacillus sp. SORGH_AS_0338]
MESQLNELLNEQVQLEQSSRQELDVEKRLEHLRKVLQKNEVLSSFDRNVFESIVEKVTVGDSTDPAQSDPHRLMFIYKTGFTNLVESKIIKQKKSFGNKRGEAHSYTLYDTCGECGGVG